jgi:hypothetical protein
LVKSVGHLLSIAAQKQNPTDKNFHSWEGCL